MSSPFNTRRTIVSLAGLVVTGCLVLAYFRHRPARKRDEDSDTQSSADTELVPPLTSEKPQSTQASTLEITFHPLKYKKFSSELMADTLVVDCTHSRCGQITHHLKMRKQRDLCDVEALCGDSSTQGVIAAIESSHTSIQENTYVTTNHFDIDSFLAVWSALFPGEA